jgi:DNA invertase Pin-like site-specific DNA recombinase
MTKCALYCRVSTADQHPETQLCDLREMARQRGYEIVREYTDVISGAKSKRPGLDQLLADARRHRFDVVLVAAFDRVARSVRHFLEVLDELNNLGIEFVSLRENIDTGGALGRAMVVIVGAIAELEKSLIVERVKAGMRRARLEGVRLGRAPLDIDRAQVVADRRSGMSLTKVANKPGISTASVCRLMKQAGNTPQVQIIAAQHNCRTSGQQPVFEAA